MTNKTYLILRLVFLGLIAGLISQVGWIVGTIVTAMVVIAGLLFANATMLSMYTAHRRQMMALQGSKKRIAAKATKGPKEDKEHAMKEVKRLQTPQK